jgi:DNA-binding XRE family transcriptional regulator
MDTVDDNELEELRRKTIEEMEKVRNSLTLTQREKDMRNIELARKLGKAFFVKLGKIPPSEED